MNCCGHCAGIEKQFNAKTASSDLRRYRRKGPLKSTRLLLDALRRESVGGMTLLDIGGGIGAIHHELLASGAESATHVDASPAYLAAAREEARRRGHESRVTFRHGDFVELAPELPPVDIVTLDRVICCYPDMERLVGLSAARARRLYGLVYPRDRWWLRSVFPLSNLYFRLRRCPFRVYNHPVEDVDAVVREQGLEPRFRGTTPLWQVVVYAR
ncbi:MAG TPA: methyltransferase domain-containing protein [Longimicrobiaceae bacterium]|nr:methyltransferase domain-containing protein [Longimicrobiaceae bacterium]